MELRAAVAGDLTGINEIDATVESHRYLHVDQTGEGLNLQWKVEDRPVRKRLVTPFAMDDEKQFAYRQVVTGIDEGICLVADNSGEIAGAMLAQQAGDLFKVIDLRVDFDHRREGLATAMLFNLIQTARESEARAISMETLTNNDPMNQMLTKLGFVLTGLDTHRFSNHDVVKETVVLFWYMTLD